MDDYPSGPLQLSILGQINTGALILPVGVYQVQLLERLPESARRRRGVTITLCYVAFVAFMLFVMHGRWSNR